MDWGVATGIVSAVVGVIGLAIAILDRRRRFPRREIVWGHTAHGIGEPTTGVKSFQVELQGIEFEDPHYNEIHLRSHSKVDIRASDFDGGNPLQLMIRNLGAFAPLARSGSLESTFRTASPDLSTISVAPQSMKRDASLSVSFMSSGPVTVELRRDPLVDVIVRREEDIPETFLSSMPGDDLLTFGIVVGGLLGFAFGALVFVPSVGQALRFLFG